jgi:adenylate cyclase
MALFGVDGEADNGCHQALNAARMMAENLRELNASLGEELKRPLRIGIGINVGPAIVGEMGYARASGLTAIGDAVNTASRLEALTKDYRADLVMARAVAERVGLDTSAYVADKVTVRGRGEPMDIVIVPNAAYLPAIDVPGAAPAGFGRRNRRYSADM